MSAGRLFTTTTRHNTSCSETRDIFFSNSQHGFIKGKSCVIQLLEFLEDILTQAFDNGDDVDVVYLDFCKAVDKVPQKVSLKNCMVIE